VSLLSFIPGLLYEEDSLSVFVLVTVVLGGGAAADEGFLFDGHAILH